MLPPARAGPLPPLPSTTPGCCRTRAPCSPPGRTRRRPPPPRSACARTARGGAHGMAGPGAGSARCGLADARRRPQGLWRQRATNKHCIPASQRGIAPTTSVPPARPQPTTRAVYPGSGLPRTPARPLCTRPGHPAAPTCWGHAAHPTHAISPPARCVPTWPVSLALMRK